MGHDHAHGGGHDHPHAPDSFGRAFAIGITLNLGFVVLETIYGVLSHSMAVVADAGQNLGSTWRLLRDSMNLVLDAAPEAPDPCRLAPEGAL